MTAALLVCSQCGAPLEPSEGQSILRCRYCNAVHAFVPAPAPEPATVDFAAGERVAIEWGGRWWPGVILRDVRPGVWLVHYDGWGSQWDEQVDRSRIRHRVQRPTGSASARTTAIIVAAAAMIGLAAVGLWVNAASKPGALRTSEAEQVQAQTVRSRAGDPSAVYRAGQAVEIEWRGTWWKGQILEVKGAAQYLIHYDGYASSWDEVVGPERLRAR